MRASFQGLALLLGLSALAAPAIAHPSQIIILRHPEKIDQFELCPVGKERAEALAHQYLGRDASQSVFPPGVKPAAVIAITLHSLELAAPVADTWSLPVTTYTVLPSLNKKVEEAELNAATRHAARKVMTDPDYAGRPVIMVWEHDHIAHRRLESAKIGQKVTLRELFNLDQLPAAPRNWNGQTYDYLWIIDYANPHSDIPTGFRMVKEDFQGIYGNLPKNDWDKPEPVDDNVGCVKIGLHYKPH
ncbi:hypothetical protein ACELLULO517_24395 [Acidisoma cellulosilytica]|uniref:Histidine phosphatase family protein n=1 Tax=Acidisoma cellulosilyticum TaxID=2802395 RepID=A0A964E669_9PROT|nr:hypothetical protein [Acidisoma cellulosilyticum]MCB8883410.1 hypothetical protein [Acidisoma cellulosilyticum]